VKLFIFAQFLLAGLYLTMATAAVSEELEPPIQAELGSIQVQYASKNCGIRNVIIIANLQYFGADKTARIESFVPKINSLLFMYISDYAAKRAGKDIRNRDVLKIIQKTADKVLGEGYIDEALVINILQD